MKKLYLTSSVHKVASRIAKDFDLKNGKNKLVFVTTATEDKEHDSSWVTNDRNSLIKAGFEVADYTIAGKKADEIRAFMNDYDFIYIEGGNTFYLLEKSQQSGFMEIIRDLILKDEKIYIGTSAGSIIAGKDTYPTLRLDDASLAPNLKGYDGYGLVDFTILPHWGSKSFKELYLNRRLEHAYEGNSQLILLRDNQYIEVKDDWYQIVEV